MELDQKSTCSLREPTIVNKQESEDFLKSKARLVDVSDLPEEMRLGQLFLQCPSRSTSEAGSSPKLRSGQKCGLSKLKGYQKDLTASSAPRLELET